MKLLSHEVIRSIANIVNSQIQAIHTKIENAVSSNAVEKNALCELLSDFTSKPLCDTADAQKAQLKAVLDGLQALKNSTNTFEDSNDAAIIKTMRAGIDVIDILLHGDEADFDDAAISKITNMPEAIFYHFSMAVFTMPPNTKVLTAWNKKLIAALKNPDLTHKIIDLIFKDPDHYLDIPSEVIAACPTAIKKTTEKTENLVEQKKGPEPSKESITLVAEKVQQPTHGDQNPPEITQDHLAILDETKPPEGKPEDTKEHTSNINSATAALSASFLNLFSATATTVTSAVTTFASAVTAVTRATTTTSTDTTGAQEIIVPEEWDYNPLLNSFDCPTADTPDLHLLYSMMRLFNFVLTLLDEPNKLNQKGFKAITECSKNLNKLTHCVLNSVFSQGPHPPPRRGNGFIT